MGSSRDMTVFISCLLLLIVQTSHGSEIINGEEVKPHSLPFMVRLVSDRKSCGGTLIHPEWVLTAAHCTGMKMAFLGVHNIKAQEKDSRQVCEVKSSFPHPNYNQRTKDNDLMLLKLNKPVKETKTVKCLPLGNTIKDPAAGSTCLVAGWGKKDFNAKRGSDVLMSAIVTVISRAKCNSSDYYNLDPVITSNMICAGSHSENVADTCQGDSGGPLLCGAVQALVGVTSFGKKCGIKDKPGVYAFLSKQHLVWIKKTMKKSEI